MKSLKKHVKIELGILVFFFLSVLIFELYGRHFINTYEEKRIEYQENLTTKSIEVDDFSKIYATVNIKIELYQGEPKVEIFSAPEVIENINIDQTSEKLSITMDNDVMVDNQLMDASLIKVYFQNLKDISSEYNNSMYFIDPVSTEDLTIEANGNSRVELTTESNDLDVSSSGNATIVVKGTTEILKGSSSGNSHLRLSNCIVQEARVNSSGNSSIRINVAKEIKGDASGNSNIRVKGNPKDRRMNSSGNASIKY